MLLTVDIGNSNIVFGLSDHLTASTAVRSFSFVWRLGTSPERTADEYSNLLYSLFQQHGVKTSAVSGIALCCVVPPLQNLFISFLTGLFSVEPLVIGPGVRTGMSIVYDNPKEVGADRIVNAVAAYRRYQSACIIIDFGTATTFDFVSAEGRYMGGAIAPGIAISAEALFQRAAKLPRVELIAPERVIGRTTVGSMQSGLYFATLGMVDRMVEEMLRETQLEEREVQVVATGGLAPLMAQGSKRMKTILPYLTLEGLAIIFDLNQRS